MSTDTAAATAAGRDKRTVRNDIVFDNVPTFDHLKSSDRPRALQQHRAWEDELRAQPDSKLHDSLLGWSHKHGLPRQTTAHLIVRYCHKKHASLQAHPRRQSVRWPSQPSPRLWVASQLEQPQPAVHF